MIDYIFKHMKVGNILIDGFFTPSDFALRAFLFLFFILFSGCYRSQDQNSRNSISPGTGKSENNSYAKGFHITNYNNFIVLEVEKPWQGSGNIRFTYILTGNSEIVPDSVLGIGDLIKLPVNRVICTSTTHIALLEALGKTETVVGVSGAGLITNKRIRKGLESGRIRDIGYGRELNYELLVSLRPDMVMLYGVESEMTGLIHKLHDLGIAVVMNAEYLEQEPLGKMEWIKYVAAFFSLEEKAKAVFDSVALRYENLRDAVITVQSRPVVMTGLPWKDVWYVSPANTVVANYIDDAGGRYLWAGLKADKAVPMDLESVYMEARDAEFWINTGAAVSIRQIIDMDARFRYFPPVVSGKVYNNIAKINTTGGNDYWESGLIHPDIILRDLIHIFHPERSVTQKLIYYKKLRP
jgi:iron complex transport system substrate-binding protein